MSRFLEAVFGIRRSKAARLGGRLLAAVFLGYLALRLAQLWRRDPVHWDEVDATVATLAVAASCIAVAAYGGVWLVVLRRFGIVARPALLGIFLKSQLGKYIPGSVWQYAGRVGLARGHAIPAPVAMVTIGVEIGCSSIAAAVVGLLVLPQPVATVTIAVAVALLITAGAGIVRLRGAARRVTRAVPGLASSSETIAALAGRALPAAFLLYALVWLEYGIAFWLTARAVFVVPVEDLPLYSGVFALAWLAGFVAIFAPGGVGVREAVIVALLTHRLGEAHAITLAGLSRLTLTAVDLVLGSAAMAFPPHSARSVTALEARR